MGAQTERKLAGTRWTTRILDESTPWDWIYRIVLVVGAVALVIWNSHMFWWYDDWDVLTPSYSVAHHGLGALLQGSGPQWTTLPLAVWRGLMSTVGLRHYLPFALPLIAAHLAVVQLSRRQLRGLGVSPPVAALLPLILLFLAAAYADLFWAFMLTFVGSVAFGLGAATLANRPELPPGRLLLVALLCVLSVMCSSAGVPFTVAVTLLVLLRHGAVKALGALVPATVAFGAWWVAYGNAGSYLPCQGAPSQPGRIPGIFARSVEKTLSGLGSVTGSSVVVLAVALVGLVGIARNRDSVRSYGAWPVAAAVSAAILYALIAIERSCLLSENGRAPRYAYFGAVLVMPLFALGLDALRRMRPALHALVPALLVLALLNNARQTRNDAKCHQQRTQQGAAQLAASFEQDLPLSAHPSTVDPQVTVAERDDLVEHHGLHLPTPRGPVPETQTGC